MGEERRPHVVVIGAGISGLAAAWRLTHPSDGQPIADVTVLEATAQPGGKLRLGEVGGLRLDMGAESMLARRPEAVALAAEVGLGADIVHPRPRTASIMARATLYPMPAGTVMGVPAGPGALEKMRGLLTDAEIARAAAETVSPITDDVSVATWVAGRVGRAVVDRLVEPLLGGVYAGHTDELSLQATIPALWLRAVQGTDLLAGPPPEGSGTQSVGSAATGPVFAGIRGGVGRLALRLAERLTADGVKIHYGTAVRGLRRTSTGWRLESGPAPAPVFHDADAVVLAVPAAPAGRLLSSESPLASSQLALVPTASVAVVAAAVPRAQLEGVEASGVLIPPVEGLAVKAVTFSSNKWDWISEGSDLVGVRLSLGRFGEEASLQYQDDDLAALAVRDLASVLGRPITPVETKVVRWGGALPQYTVGHVGRVASIRAGVAELPRLTICGAVLDGVGLPACIASADRAVRELDLTTWRIDA